MKRNDFLKKLGFGALAVAIAPKMLAEIPAKETKLNITTGGQLNPSAFKTPSEVLDEYKRTGRVHVVSTADSGYDKPTGGWYSRTFRMARDRETGMTIYTKNLPDYWYAND